MKIGAFDINDVLPDIERPHAIVVLRPWIDVGNIGTLALSRIERHLKSEEIGRLAAPGTFYDFTRYRPRSYFNEGIRQVNVPNTTIRCSTVSNGPSLITIHLLEPQLYGEEFTDSVIELIKWLKVERYCLIGGMYDMVPHTRPLLVSGLGNGGTVKEEQLKMGVQQSTYEGPTTITYLVSQEAERIGIETRTFVAHLPQYLDIEDDFVGTAKLVEILCNLYELPEHLIDKQKGSDQYAKLQDTVETTEGMTELMQKLEERYDNSLTDESNSLTQLSPDIEKFLRELGEDI
ncbi:MAG: PAC2 family protein [SAR202 cluster bacterium]|jgi:hypothetical protein|nr:MAG: PAC2 family protein [SAR202 cluster bacterium]MCH2526445.1 PAC2 family protein [Dehalococcoidia bacterium]MQG81002.1 PAC2 family protein [SAR202 cluster bacterium]GIS83195.1 MAG: hypothetical protein CM1200mP15_18270 [Dehalococcoidia bacterium]|tara:strand:- start:482 stop:1351 length:870 start_codon:yes stop_codon:yes gene_type:complete